MRRESCCLSPEKVVDITHLVKISTRGICIVLWLEKKFTRHVLGRKIKFVMTRAIKKIANEDQI